MSSSSRSNTTLTVPIGPHDHVQGAASAPRVLLEYGDFECPHCRRAYDIVKRLRDELGDAMRFAYRHFPLTNAHPHAQRAAETAEWAAVHGRFWPMHDYLFEHQDRLDERGLLDAARALDLDPGELQRAWESHAHIARIKDDLRGGLASGVAGTPGFFIDGRRCESGWDEASLRAALIA